MTTTVTTTTTVSSEPTLGFNFGFFKSPLGIFMLVEIILGAVCWSTNVTVHERGIYALASFFIIFTWVSTLVIYLILLLGIHSLCYCCNARCGLIQIIFHLAWFIMTVAFACIMATIAKYHQNIAIATALGFLLAVLYLVSFGLAFRNHYNRFPWQC